MSPTSSAATSLVAIPLSRGQVGELIRSASLSGPLQGFIANEALVATFALVESDNEQAEFATLQIASIAGLAAHGVRVVLIANVPKAEIPVPEDLLEAHNGAVQLTGLSARWVESFFTEDPNVDPAPAARACAGLDLDAAWEVAEVQELLGQTDLLWHSSAELGLISHD